MDELVASPPPAPPLSSPHAEAPKEEEQRQELTMEKKEQQQQQQQRPQQEHAQEQQQQLEAPPPPPPRKQHQSQQLPAKAAPTPWAPLIIQELPVGLRALIARSDPDGTWCGVRDDEGEHGDDYLKQRTGVRTSNMVSIFGSRGKEPGHRRLTRPRRERVREKENLSPTCDGNARYRHIFYLM